MSVPANELLAMLRDAQAEEVTPAPTRAGEQAVDDDYFLAQLFNTSAANAREFAEQQATSARAVSETSEQIMSLIESLEETRSSWVRRTFDPIVELFNYDESIAGQTANLRVQNLKRGLQVQSLQAQEQQHRNDQAAVEAGIAAAQYQRQDALLDLTEETTFNRDLVAIKDDAEFRREMKARGISATGQQTLTEHRAEYKETGRVRAHTAAIQALQLENAETAAKLQRNMDLTLIQDEDEFEAALHERPLSGAIAHDIRNIRNEFLHTNNMRRVQRANEKDLEAMLERGDPFATDEFARRSARSRAIASDQEFMRPLVLRHAGIDELATAVDQARANGTATIGKHTFQLAELQDAFQGATDSVGRKRSLEVSTAILDDSINDITRDIGRISGVTFPVDATTAEMMDSPILQSLPGPIRRTMNAQAMLLRHAHAQAELGEITPARLNETYAGAFQALNETFAVHRTRIEQNLPEKEQAAAREFLVDGVVSSGENARQSLASALGPTFGTGSNLHDAPLQHVWQQFLTVQEGGEAAGDLQQTINALQGAEPSELREKAINRLLQTPSVVNQMQTVQATVAMQEATKAYVDEYVRANPNDEIVAELMQVRTNPTAMFETIIAGATPDIRARVADKLRRDFLTHYARVIEGVQPHGPQNIQMAALNRIMWNNSSVLQLNQMGQRFFFQLASPLLADNRGAEERDRDELRGVLGATLPGFGF